MTEDKQQTLSELEKTENEISQLMIDYFNKQKKPANLLFEWHLSRHTNIVLQIWKGTMNNYFSICRLYRDKENKIMFHTVILSKRQLLVLRDLTATAFAEFEKIERGEVSDV